MGVEGGEFVLQNEHSKGPIRGVFCTTHTRYCETIPVCYTGLRNYVRGCITQRPRIEKRASCTTRISEAFQREHIDVYNIDMSANISITIMGFRVVSVWPLRALSTSIASTPSLIWRRLDTMSNTTVEQLTNTSARRPPSPINDQWSCKRRQGKETLRSEEISDHPPSSPYASSIIIFNGRTRAHARVRRRKHIGVSVRSRTYVDVFEWRYVHTYVCSHACKQAMMKVCMYVCVRTYACMHTCSYTCMHRTCVLVRARTRTYTSVYVCTKTNKD